MGNCLGYCWGVTRITTYLAYKVSPPSLICLSRCASPLPPGASLGIFLLRPTRGLRWGTGALRNRAGATPARVQRPLLGLRWRREDLPLDNLGRRGHAGHCPDQRCSGHTGWPTHRQRGSPTHSRVASGRFRREARRAGAPHLQREGAGRYAAAATVRLSVCLSVCVCVCVCVCVGDRPRRV